MEMVKELAREPQLALVMALAREKVMETARALATETALVLVMEMQMETVLPMVLLLATGLETGKASLWGESALEKLLKVRPLDGSALKKLL